MSSRLRATMTGRIGRHQCGRRIPNCALTVNRPVAYACGTDRHMYERGEDRFFESLRPAYRLIMDLDDTTSKPYGELYTSDNPLTLEKIMPPAG